MRVKCFECKEDFEYVPILNDDGTRYKPKKYICGECQ